MAHGYAGMTLAERWQAAKPTSWASAQEYVQQVEELDPQARFATVGQSGVEILFSDGSIYRMPQQPEEEQR